MFNMLIKQIVHIKSFTFTYFIKLKTLLNFFKRVFKCYGCDSLLYFKQGFVLHH